MATKFTDVYDELRTNFASALSTHTEINNAHAPEEDADIMYDKGWGLAIGPSTNLNRNLCPLVSINREFALVITQRYFTPQRDIDNRILAEKAAFNYQLDAIKGVIGYTSDNIVKVNYTADNGLEYLEGDRYGYIILQTLFEVEYFESY